MYLFSLITSSSVSSRERTSGAVRPRKCWAPFGRPMPRDGGRSSRSLGSNRNEPVASGLGRVDSMMSADRPVMLRQWPRTCRQRTGGSNHELHSSAIRLHARIYTHFTAACVGNFGECGRRGIIAMGKTHESTYHIHAGRRGALCIRDSRIP
jgi:hypothetical protein